MKSAPDIYIKPEATLEKIITKVSKLPPHGPLKTTNGVLLTILKATKADIKAMEKRLEAKMELIDKNGVTKE